MANLDGNFARLAQNNTQQGPVSNPRELMTLLQNGAMTGRAKAEGRRARGKSKSNARSHGTPTIQLPEK